VIVGRDVSVRLGDRTVLDRVSITVADGEWVSVVGPNGAGKSTLLRALAGLVPAEGDITLGDSSLAALPRRARARLVAVVPQSPVVPPDMTVTDYVLLGRTPYISPLGREGPSDLDAVRRVLEQLDLVAFADRALDTLSGGERQRTFVARALAQAAPILLLDEPTTALDVGHQQEVLELVDRLRRENGLTVLMTMHDLTLAGEYAERLVLLDGGQVMADGPAEDVLTEENLSRFYGANVRVVAEGGAVVVVPVRKGSEVRR
jgi:iron complex transport system ATP-binding protein